ncbi:MAG: hypothetical protein JJU36_16010 [Phycisphaeraceae bacterium]|nr:hypothetical protein [Phycisphaeraceae bacterium]
MLMDTPNKNHPRRRPATRPAPPELVDALDVMIRRVRAGPHSHSAPNRHEVIYDRDGLTVLLMVLARPSHPLWPVAAGVVTMHVLQGSIALTYQDQLYELRSGQMLVLAPAITQPGAADGEAWEFLKVVVVDDTPELAIDRAVDEPAPFGGEAGSSRE